MPLIQKNRKTKPKVVLKQIKALTRTPTGEMDYKEADAVNEPERRGERDIR